MNGIDKQNKKIENKTWSTTCVFQLKNLEMNTPERRTSSYIFCEHKLIQCSVTPVFDT